MVLVAVSTVAATFGIQNATPCPAATYACCPARMSANAIRRLARVQIELAHGARSVAICFSE